MLHEVSFPSYNKRDEVQGWIYVPAARPKGIVQIIHGFGEHSRRYLHMISKFMDAGFIVAADDHVGHGKTAMVSGVWGDWGDAGFHTMMEDEHTLKELVCEKYPNLPYFLFGHSMGSFIARDYAAKYGDELAGVTICGTTGSFSKKPWTTAWGPIPIRNLPAPSWVGCVNAVTTLPSATNGSVLILMSSATMRRIPSTPLPGPPATGPCMILPR